MSKDDKDILFQNLVGNGVCNGLIYFSWFHVQISAQWSPKHSFKRGQAALWNDAGYVAKIQTSAIKVGLFSITLQEWSSVVVLVVE